MKASQVIARLAELIMEHGDLPVIYDDSEYGVFEVTYIAPDSELNEDVETFCVSAYEPTLLIPPPDFPSPPRVEQRPSTVTPPRAPKRIVWRLANPVPPSWLKLPANQLAYEALSAKEKDVANIV